MAELNASMKMRYAILRMGYANAERRVSRVMISLGPLRATVLSESVHVVAILLVLKNLKYATPTQEEELA